MAIVTGAHPLKAVCEEAGAIVDAEAALAPPAEPGMQADRGREGRPSRPPKHLNQQAL